ncbi:YSIRK signal domain/LPXTG anchor domain surface protein [Ligilactobacillus apodemi]|uniref:Gram-positive cocci surface proteins LPxTG domain-containing protein n=1 Tax=Ligilactobacillus apodemi DSM 16634 = JCM 16172 TaxID=1423724 RepID=A0A0R1U1S1_9LACO|nr:YSIRK signal domain/LPXTG anchor domain surface protein [Ligilactobacillus apodemi]KRL84834.1 hypothetical protein FC32_GL000315 [Ligilactobacillus apodemi DSM 16634 = JCM 16172]
MLSKNNHKLYNQKLAAKKQRFTIKRLSVGVASILVGTLFMTYSGGTQVSADTQVASTQLADANESNTAETTTSQASTDLADEDATAENTAETVTSEAATSASEATSEVASVASVASEQQAFVATAEPETTAPTSEAQPTMASEATSLAQPAEVTQPEIAESEAPVQSQATSASAPNSESGYFRSATLRAARPNEVKVYGFSGQVKYKGDGQVTSMNGYIDKEKHTTNSESVRVEVQYIPTESNKNQKTLPISVELTGNANYTLPSTIMINGSSVPLTSDGYYYSSSVKANANVENTIEFTVKVTGRLNKVTSFNIYIATANATYNKEFPAKYSGQAYVKNTLVATNTFDGKIYQEVLKELEAPADKIEKVEIPFETKYLADQSLTAGQRIVEKKGVLGEKTVTTTYTLNSENKFVGKTSEQITKEPETELVRVGTKPEIQEESIPFETIYQEDSQMDPTAAEVIVTPGVPGKKVTSTTYQLNEVTGEITATTTTKTTDPVSQVVKHSPTGEIAFQTQYRENPELTAGETKVVQAGVVGSSNKVYDAVNGHAVVEFNPKTEASTTREPQLIMVLVELSGVVGNSMYLTNDVSKLAPLWDQMEDGDRLLWISALRIPEKFDDAQASYSVKGKDQQINPLEKIGTISASDIPARYNITAEDMKNAEIRLETDLFTQDANSLVNNKGLMTLLNQAGSRVISIRNVGRQKQEFKKYGLAEAAFQKAGIPYKLDDREGLLSVTPNLIPTIVYKPLDITIEDASGELKITTAQLSVGDKVINLPVTNGKVQTTYTPDSETPITISYDFAGTATAERTLTVKVTADGNEVAKLETAVQPKLHLETKAPVTQIIEVGTKPVVTTEKIPYETIYITDETMLADAPEVVLVEGKEGQKVTTINYTLDLQTGKVTAQAPKVEVTVQPVNREVKRGAGQATTMPYSTIYQASEELDLGQQVIRIKGKNGLLLPNGVVSRAPMPEWILVGTKPTVVETVLEFSTQYEDDALRLPTDPEIVVTPGRNGKTITTTKYKVNSSTGEVTALEPVVETTPAVDEVIRRGVGKTTLVPRITKYVANVTLPKGETHEMVAGTDGVIHPNGDTLVAMEARVIEVGAKPVIVETRIEPQVIYQEDPTMKKEDPEIVLVEGLAGKKTITTSFRVNEITGMITEITKEEVVAPIDRVVKVGVGSEVVIPYMTQYEADATMIAGETAVKVAGQTGIKHPNGTVTTAPVTEVILVGTKAAVTEETLAPQVIYQEDATMKKEDPQVVVVEGQAGKKITTVTYTLDETTGKVSANEPVVEITAPIDRVIKVGVGNESTIPYLTKYEADETMTAGETKVKVAGQTGIKHPNGTVTKAPVTEIILVGTKASVSEATIALKVIYQKDPTMKQEDPQIVVVEGQTGKEITTVTYTLDETTGKVTANESVVETIAPVDRVIKVGVGEDTVLPYETKYEADETMTAGETKVKVAGQTGIKHPNGTVTKEPVTEIILVGTKPVVTEEEIAFEVICVDDPTLPAGTVVKVQNGQAGKKIITTTYIVDENTGELTPITTEEVLEPVTELVKRGTKPAEVITTVKEEVKVMPVETPAAPKQEVAKPAQVKEKELPQTGDTTENTAILGAVGILLALGLVAYDGRKKRPE